MKVFLVLTVTLMTSPAFLQQHPDPALLTHTAEKLRWYRLRNELLQKQVADRLGIDRSTYIHYENTDHDRYPKDKLQKAAVLFDVPITALLDDYNRFIFGKPGKRMKSLRKKYNLTQAELARLLHTTCKTVKEWESNRVTISKMMWRKLNCLK